MSLLANSNAIESGGYNIDRSLRFRGSASAYLSRTPASNGNLQTWTYSAWVKRGSLAATFNNLLSAGSNNSCLMFNADTIMYYEYNGSTILNQLTTTAVYRDTSAWYHIVLAIDTNNATASNRTKLYVNGVQVTAFSTATYPTSGQQTYWNRGSIVNYICLESANSRYFDGYLAEVNFIDGQALTPSSFGQTDAVTGVWTPKKYTGTYGTNGFYLPFSDNTSATTLAYDKSGNGNNWTPNNISTTAGATYDSMTDVPTLTSATAANYCVINPLDTNTSPTISDGNLGIASSGATWKTARSTISITSGKWYWEAAITANSNDCEIGVCSQSIPLAEPATLNPCVVVATGSGYKIINGSTTAYGASFAIGDIIGIAYDADGGTITFYKNNVSQGAITTGFSAGVYSPVMALYGRSGGNTTGWMNFGQRPFSYTPPTGFKALNTFNLPDPTIKKPNQYMDATTYTGTGSALTVTNAGGFQPDLLWIKVRSTTDSHNLFDSVRGSAPNYNYLQSNTTGAEGTPGVTMVSSLNSNGFTLGTNAGQNANGATYVGWQWKKGATPGFDIVTYTGTGSARTVNHNLGVAPAMMLVKCRSNDTGDGFIVYHKSLPSASYWLDLHNTGGQSGPNSVVWNGTAPTSSVFSVGSATGTNINTYTYVNYLFSEIAGFSKFGSYTGNGSADGPFVYCGFRPKYVMVKRTDGTGSWQMKDTARNASNLADLTLFSNLSNAEYNTFYFYDLLSNGFKVRGTDAELNASGATYIYAAFAETPFRFALAR